MVGKISFQGIFTRLIKPKVDENAGKRSDFVGAKNGSDV